MTTFTPRQARIVMFQGDDEARLIDLEDEARRAREAAADAPPAGLMDGEPAWRVKAQEYDEFLAEAKARATVVVVQALPRKVWKSLVDEHPPREGNREDAAVGANEDTLSDALVPPSVVEPEFGRDADRDAFLDSLSSAQFERLYLTAFALNRGQQADPKDGLLAELSRSSTET